MKVYTVYYLEEQKNELGNPYIGCSFRLEGRAKQHKTRLGLDYIPTLHPIQSFQTSKEARKFEQITKVANGWEKEGSQSGKRVKDNGLGIFALSEEEKLRNCSEGGKIQGPKNVENGHMDRIRKIWANSPNHPNKQRVICPHCNKEGNKPAMIRHHFNNCKHIKSKVNG
jgi:hypothetical protein